MVYFIAIIIAIKDFKTDLYIITLICLGVYYKSGATASKVQGTNLCKRSEQKSFSEPPHFLRTPHFFVRDPSTLWWRPTRAVCRRGGGGRSISQLMGPSTFFYQKWRGSGVPWSKGERSNFKGGGSSTPHFQWWPRPWSNATLGGVPCYIIPLSINAQSMHNLCPSSMHNHNIVFCDYTDQTLPLSWSSYLQQHWCKNNYCICNDTDQTFAQS